MRKKKESKVTARPLTEFEKRIQQRVVEFGANAQVSTVDNPSEEHEYKAISAFREILPCLSFEEHQDLVTAWHDSRHGHGNTSLIDGVTLVVERINQAGFEG